MILNGGDACNMMTVTLSTVRIELYCRFSNLRTYPIRHDTLTQWLFNDGPISATLPTISPSFGPRLVFAVYTECVTMSHLSTSL